MYIFSNPVKTEKRVYQYIKEISQLETFDWDEAIHSYLLKEIKHALHSASMGYETVSVPGYLYLLQLFVMDITGQAIGVVHMNETVRQKIPH